MAIGLVNEPKAPALRWILCDLGKTLVHFDHLTIAQKLIHEIQHQHPGSGVNPLELYNWFFTPQENGTCRNVEVDCGRMTIAELAEQFNEHYTLSLFYSEFRLIWNDIFTYEHENVLEAMGNARKQGVQVAITSSTNEAHWNFILGKYPRIRSLTPRAFLTFELGCMKTDPGFFEAILQHTGAAPGEHLLIDDLPANLEAAMRLGIPGLLYSGKLPDWELFSAQPPHLL